MTPRVKFVDAPPIRGRGPNKTGKYESFANLLRDNPGKWAVLPKRKSGASDSAAAAVRNGRLRGFVKGEFEAVSRSGEVYVRYLGPVAAKKKGRR